MLCYSPPEDISSSAALISSKCKGLVKCELSTNKVVAICGQFWPENVWPSKEDTKGVVFALNGDSIGGLDDFSGQFFQSYLCYVTIKQ